MTVTAPVQQVHVVHREIVTLCTGTRGKDYAWVIGGIRPRELPALPPRVFAQAQAQAQPQRAPRWS